MQKAIDVERRIACVIWVLAAQRGYCTAGHLFGIFYSSISNIMLDVCFAIAMILLTAPPDPQLEIFWVTHTDPSVSRHRK